MKKNILFILPLAFLVSLTANAQLLWKVSGNGLTRNSYLFGTHHLIDRTQIKNFDQILAICDQADAVVGEIEMNDTDLQAKVMNGALMTEGTIKDLLSPEDYIFLDNEFKLLLGTGLDHLGKMKPMMLDNLFGILCYMKENSMNKQPDAVDMIFQKNATDNNKKIIGLETVEDQVYALFGSLSLKRQAEILMKDVRKKQKGIDLLKQLNKLYLAGNLVGLEALNQEDDSMTLEEKKALEETRNINWMIKLPALLNEQSCFIAFGCLHLTGESGLINQLKKVGYSVEPIVF